MRLRFLGAPHLSKSSHQVIDTVAACKEECAENAEAKTVSPPTSANDLASVRQLRQRRVGVGLWAIRRQKLERAQLRPRIVVHMSRLRGRKTAADYAAASLRRKHKLLRSSGNDTLHTMTIENGTLPDINGTRNVTGDSLETGIAATNGFKLERPEEDGVRDDVDNSRTGDKEGDGKPSGDAVNSRPKRHILHKKMVSV